MEYQERWSKNVSRACRSKTTDDFKEVKPWQNQGMSRELYTFNMLRLKSFYWFIGLPLCFVISHSSNFGFGLNSQLKIT